MFIQEEIEKKVVAISVQTGKMTGRVLQSALREYLRYRQNNKGKNGVKVYKGKQTLKQLMSSGAALTNIDITNENIKSFESVAKKYDIDFSLHKDKSKEPPVFYVFFKSKDADVMNMAFNEYAQKNLRRQDKPSIRKTLAQLIEKAKSAPSKDRTHRQEGRTVADRLLRSKSAEHRRREQEREL